MKKAVFLDRDGTMIVDEHYLNDPKKIQYLPDLFPTLRALEDLGYTILVVTNQSGLSRGLVDLDQMDAIHKKMTEDAFAEGVHIRKFYYAPFLDESHREERKPGAGMLKLAALDFGLSLKDSWMVGDKMSDVWAGQNAGCQSILLDSEGKLKGAPLPARSFSAQSLRQILALIQNHSS